MCLSEDTSPFYKDMSNTGLDSTLRDLFQLVTSAKTFFPNKVTF